jgi:hypothetical protein
MELLFAGSNITIHLHLNPKLHRNTLPYKHRNISPATLYKLRDTGCGLISVGSYNIKEERI